MTFDPETAAAEKHKETEASECGPFTQQYPPSLLWAGLSALSCTWIVSDPAAKTNRQLHVTVVHGNHCHLLTRWAETPDARLERERRGRRSWGKAFWKEKTHNPKCLCLHPNYSRQIRYVKIQSLVLKHLLFPKCRQISPSEIFNFTKKYPVRPIFFFSSFWKHRFSHRCYLTKITWHSAV